MHAITLKMVTATAVLFLFGLASACVEDYPSTNYADDTNGAITHLGCDSQAITEHMISWDLTTRTLRIQLDGAPLGETVRFLSKPDTDELVVFYLPVTSQPCEDPFATQSEIEVRDIPEELGEAYMLSVTGGDTEPDYARPFLHGVYVTGPFLNPPLGTH